MAEPQPAQTNQPAGPAAPSPSLAEADAAPRCARCGNVLNPGFGFCTVCGAIPGKSDMEAPAQAGPISMSYEPPARPAGPIAAMPPRASLLEPKPVDSHAVNPMVFASVLLGILGLVLVFVSIPVAGVSLGLAAFMQIVAPLCSIAAIALGHAGRYEISHGKAQKQGGFDMAVLGLLAGYGAIVIVLALQVI